VNLVIAIIVTWDLSKAFGHGFGFFLGLVLLGWLFYIILGWGGSKYVGSAA